MSFAFAPGARVAQTPVDLAFEPFDFYELGEVRPAHARASQHEHAKLTVFSFVLERAESEQRWIYLVAIDRELAATISQAPDAQGWWPEMANVLASRVADRLATTQGGRVLCSLPTEVAEQSWDRLLDRLALNEAETPRQLFVFAGRPPSARMVPIWTFLATIGAGGYSLGRSNA